MSCALKWTAPEGLTLYNTPVLWKITRRRSCCLEWAWRTSQASRSTNRIDVDLCRWGKGGRNGLELPSAANGKAQVTQCWNQKYSYWRDETLTDLVVLNTADGNEAKRISFIKDVAVTSYDEATKSFTTKTGVNLDEIEPSTTVFPAWHANIDVHPYVYFQCFYFRGKRGKRTVNLGPRNSIARNHKK